jgi:hypothetical protein
VAFFGMFDLLAGGGLIAGLITAAVAAVRMRSARVIARENGGRAAAGRVRRTGAVTALWIFGAALVLLVLFNVLYFNGFGTDPVLGSPTRAQVTGTWIGDHGAILVLRADGTFTASGLPSSLPVSGSLPAQPSGHGTWVIGPGDFSGPPESVIFTFACDAGPGGCAGPATTFDLQAETSSPSGGGGSALFYYLGDPDDWSDQYPFVREQ